MSIKRFSFALLCLFVFFGCASLVTFPEYRTPGERLRVLEELPAWPLQSGVTIHWHPRMIPFVEAESDTDAAFALGVVHAHLRLGQMELLRYISAGRLAEVAGPFVAPKIDHMLRIINLQRSAEKLEETLTDSERQWMQHFVDGINFFQKHMPEAPVEFSFLQIEPKPWSITDALRVGRLAAADINWANFLRFLPLQKEKGWQNVWQNRIRQSSRSATSSVAMTTVLEQFTRSGSNSLVVSGKKTKSGSAIIANDPHLGIFLPNFWLLLGFKSPSYHVLGFMVPGVPSVVVGRNKDIAWGGTYMRGISSYLMRVEPQDVVSQRQEKIIVRGWFDTSKTVRESAKGPIFSDAENIDVDRKNTLALQWVGHQPSNELGAFLRASQAKNWQEFSSAFSEYAVAGLNLTYADSKGNIGLLLAIRQPLLNDPTEQLALIKSKENFVKSYRSPLELPKIYNPNEGFIASSNNMPMRIEPQIALPAGQSDRVLRLQQLARSSSKVEVKEVKQWQQDVFSIEADKLNQKFVNRLQANKDKLHADLQDYFLRLQNWNGVYDVDSTGAPAFEILSWQLAQDIFQEKIRNEKLRKALLSGEDWRYLLIQEWLALEGGSQFEYLQQAMFATLKNVAKLPNWGTMHRQVMQHPFGRVPLLGSRFVRKTYPAAGASTTINKASFRSSIEKQNVTFGAQSRHISDLADADTNWFVLLGGNDGWLNNDHLDDQVDLWREGKYLSLPLRLSSVRQQFSLAKTKPRRSESARAAEVSP